VRPSRKGGCPWWLGTISGGRCSGGPPALALDLRLIDLPVLRLTHSSISGSSNTSPILCSLLYAPTKRPLSTAAHHRHCLLFQCRQVNIKFNSTCPVSTPCHPLSQPTQHEKTVKTHLIIPMKVPYFVLCTVTNPSPPHPPSLAPTVDISRNQVLSSGALGAVPKHLGVAPRELSIDGWKSVSEAALNRHVCAWVALAYQKRCTLSVVVYPGHLTSAVPAC
jgi:hypothetical protein